MSSQQVIICDDKGNPTGEYVEKELAHTGEGRHHLAITVLLENSKGEVLLQHRKHKRFDGFWDLTGATDLYHLKDHDESFEEATLRCLKREYGIEKIEGLNNLGGFNYFMKDKDFCENEFCAILIAKFDGNFKLNPEVGYDTKWQNKKDFFKDIKNNPNKYTPWAIESIKFLHQIEK